MKFYSKKAHAAPAKAMNLNAVEMLEKAVSKSCIQHNAVCAYNPFSYMNLNRIYESDV